MPRLGHLLYSFLLAWPRLVAAAEPASSPPSSPHFQAWSVGSETKAGAAVSTRGGLLLLGGGGDVTKAWHWFVACAGGGDVVVLRASGADAYQEFLYKEIGGFSSVTTLLLLDREASGDPAVLARLTSAEAIFIAGGDQALYVERWKGTPLASVLNAHVRAGKPLGGTSAGLAVLGEFYFAALHDTITSDEALRDPFDQKVTLDTGLLSIPLLSGILTDSHFSARDRLGRLMVFLARLEAAHPGDPRVLGLGVDEGTALCVEPDGVAHVYTEKGGAVWLVSLSEGSALNAGQPLTAKARVSRIEEGTTFQLSAGKTPLEVPAAEYEASAGKVGPAR